MSISNKAVATILVLIMFALMVMILEGVITPIRTFELVLLLGVIYALWLIWSKTLDKY